jgi:ABC-2 type transport system permease protein
MTERHAMLTVARWEFLRFLKPKQQLISFCVTIVINVALGGIGYLISESRAKPVTVGILGVERLGRTAPTVDRVTWRTESRDESALRRQVDDKTIDGYLVVESADSARFVLRDKARWPDRVQRTLDSLRTIRLVSETGVSPTQLAALGSRMVVTTTYTKRARDSSRGDQILAFGILLFVFSGVITGVSYLFTGITGEKQLRVTESVLSAISPQAWLDGKIIGQMGVAIVGITTTYTSLGLMGATAWFVFRDKLPAITLPHVSAFHVVLMVVLALLGMLLWYAALGAFTSTIDDPNNSMRSTALLLPMLPIGVAWSVQDKADSVVATVLSVFPLTSYAVLPVRLAITTTEWWEVPLALVLLVITIWAVRRAGGRLFAAGVQMYGKEPGWREMWRALRATD